MERPKLTEIKEKKTLAQKQMAMESSNTKVETTPNKEEEKSEEKKEKVKTIIDHKVKKNEAIVNATSVPISLKHSIAICDMIRNKHIEDSIKKLEEVVSYNRAVPMKGEIPHRKGKIMSGRYPINAASHFIKLLKSLKSNAIVNEIEIEKFVIECKANNASRPYRRFGKGKFKRTHITLKLINKTKKSK